MGQMGQEGAKGDRGCGMDMAQPLISIIVPVYNTEPYLRRCLESIVSQDIGACELILVDDGSKDGSGKILDEYAARFEGVRAIHQDNAGVSAARNAGLEQALGAYVWFCDSDDRLLPNAVGKLKELLGQGEPDLVAFPAIQEDERQERLGLIPEPSAAAYLSLGPIEAGDELFAITHVMRRSLIGEERFDCGLALYEDRDFMYKVCLRAKRPVVGHEPLYAYLITREGSAMNALNPADKLAGNRVHRDILLSEIALGRPEAAYRIYIDQTLGALSLMAKKQECLEGFDGLRAEMLSFDSYSGLLSGSHKLKYRVCKSAPGLFKAIYRLLGRVRKGNPGSAALVK